jgi:hypothetical protein
MASVGVSRLPPVGGRVGAPPCLKRLPARGRDRPAKGGRWAFKRKRRIPQRSLTLDRLNAARGVRVQTRCGGGATVALSLPARGERRGPRHGRHGRLVGDP